MIRATVLVLVLLAAPVFAGEEVDAKECFESGQKCLAKGDFEAAATPEIKTQGRRQQPRWQERRRQDR